MHNFITPEGWLPILNYLRDFGIEKINIAGGEPFHYPHLDHLCKLLKSMGFKVSIVSNGSRIPDGWFERMHPYIDRVGLSVDSSDEIDEISIGRHADNVNHIENIKQVAVEAHKFGVRVKLNITAVRKSIGKDFGALIDSIRLDRVKVFRPLILNGENDDLLDTWSVTDKESQSFIDRYSEYPNIIFEDNSDMIGSYLMFDPIGRWMVNSKGLKDSFRSRRYLEMVSRPRLIFPYTMVEMQFTNGNSIA